MGTLGRLKHAWNAFLNENVDYRLRSYDMGASYGTRPDRVRLRLSNERSIMASIYTRIAIDVSDVKIRHVRLDDSDRYLEDMNSGLNECLLVKPNLDQSPRALRQDIVLSMFEKSCIAIVTVDTTLNPELSGGYDIQTLRVGEIVQWFPRHVRVSLYNESTGRRQEVTLDKNFVAIVENPLYLVMNEFNSTLSRLIRKLNLLDNSDENSVSGKLDMIIQLPYVIKTDARRQQAEQRRKEIEFQLRGSEYGIAYTDGTEKITQLNRPLENQLKGQVEYLMNLLYVELGLTPEVMNGTADEATMRNYQNRTVKPILDAITEAMLCKFLTKTARSQKQSIKYFIDPFALVPVSQMAEIADKFTRNEILTSNEVRQIIGMKPASDPKADQLVNSNMPQAVTGVPPVTDSSVASEDSSILEDAFGSVNKTLDDIFSGLGVSLNGSG